MKGRCRQASTVCQQRPVMSWSLRLLGSECHTLAFVYKVSVLFELTPWLCLWGLFPRVGLHHAAPLLLWQRGRPLVGGAAVGVGPQVGEVVAGVGPLVDAVAAGVGPLVGAVVAGVGPLVGGAAAEVGPLVGGVAA